MEDALLVALKALADPTRLRIAGRLAEGAQTASELSRALGMPPGLVRRHLERLLTAELAGREGTGAQTRYALRIEGFHELGRQIAAAEGSAATGPGIGPNGEPLPSDVARILRGYFDDDRLTAIPANAAKRLVVLSYLRDRCFTEPRGYPEKEVNQRLAIFHPDVAALRRSMVDSGLMTRAAGEYRRPD